MVKRQKEKQYQSSSEHRANAKLRSGRQDAASAVRKLPFDCCALSLIPFTNPVCDSRGIVFEKSAIGPFLQEHKIDPVEGKPMSAKDLIALNMIKDEEGRWQCPILNKALADHMKVVAIRQNPPGNKANVYSWEAYQELNVKARSYEDLTSGFKFTKADVIILNSDDPSFQQLRDINSFYHIRNQRELEKNKPRTTSNNIRHSVTASRILDKVNKAATEDKKRAPSKDLQKEGKRLKIFAEDVTGVKLTTGKGSGSFTSTSMTVANDNEGREATQKEIQDALFQVMRQQKKKGYVKLQTNKGDILLEIHCDLVPRTSFNFIKLCEAKKYNGSAFHRLIKNFMIQGGKPAKEAEDQDDESTWGEPFKDEFNDKLSHDGPGVLSMANAGPHTNRRQFFLTFKNCEYLNKKHSVFGLVVEGMELLKQLEKMPTDQKDRPLKPIKIEDTVIVENPVQEAEEAEMRRIGALAAARKAKGGSGKKATKTDAQSSSATKKLASAGISQIGRYLPKAAAASSKRAGGLDLPPPKPKTSNKQKGKFGNFSGW